MPFNSTSLTRRSSHLEQDNLALPSLVRLHTIRLPGVSVLSIPVLDLQIVQGFSEFRTKFPLAVADCTLRLPGKR